MNKYPIYVISKGRFNNCLTANFLIKDKVPFHLVVEPQEAKEYIKRFGQERIYILPFSNLGLGSIPARNWVWEHSKTNGNKRHWILDDNMRGTYRLFKGKRIRCNSRYAFSITENFIDRYENVGIAGLAYTMFVIRDKIPFRLNCHVYSCLLIDNNLPYRWRGRYNEDTDLCLQVLSGGFCTVLMIIFSIHKTQTMKMKGGNTDQLYQADGRLKMARSLEKRWYGVVETKRRWGRPQHVIKNAWRRFDTPLKLKDDIKLEEKPNEFGMKLIKLKEPRSLKIKELLEISNNKLTN